MTDPSRVFYIVDPMCSWCWGFHETVQEFKQIVCTASQVQWVYVMGGLAPDSDEPMPIAMCQQIQQHWHAVAQRSAAQFNFDFWTKCQPRRSTWPACRAVIAAGLQGEVFIAKMLEAIQRAYYTQAHNPSDRETLENLADVIGLNLEKFKQDLNSDRVNQLFRNDRNRAHAFGVSGFPALAVEKNDKTQILSSGYLDLDSLIKRWRLL